MDICSISTDQDWYIILLLFHTKNYVPGKFPRPPPLTWVILAILYGKQTTRGLSRFETVEFCRVVNSYTAMSCMNDNVANAESYPTRLEKRTETGRRDSILKHR